MLNLPSTRRRRGRLSGPPSRFVHLHLEELETRAVPAVGVNAFPGPQPTDFNNTSAIAPLSNNSQFTFASMVSPLGNGFQTLGTQIVPGFGGSLYPSANGIFTFNAAGESYNLQAQMLGFALPSMVTNSPYSAEPTMLPLELNTVFVPTVGPRGLPLSTPAPLPVTDPAQYQLMRFLNAYSNPNDTIAWSTDIYLNRRVQDVGGAGNQLPEPTTTPANQNTAPTEENLLQYIRVLGDARPVHPAANKEQTTIDRTAPRQSEKETPRVEPAHPAAAPEAPTTPVEQPKASADTIAFWTVKTPEEMFWDTPFDTGDLPAPVINSWTPVVDALAFASTSSDGDGGDAGDLEE